MSSKPSKRPLKVRIKPGGGRSPASKRWLERQLNDPYVARAKREGFSSRAAFKLIEIDDKHHLLKQGARVVDLGAATWLQPPGAAPRSTTRAPCLSKWCLSSISISLKAAREGKPSRLARAT